ncbi:MAG: sugar ABC transporter ATP-binding protein [Hyphomicrobiales bacterium]|nr:sugar ABC transporter ATP-binding protein [Hyphomicrobiales bacterium]
MTPPPDAGPPAPPPALVVERASKGFPGVKALREASLTLHAGEATALIGENGAGKSTLVKILSGLHAPDEGTIEIAGRRVAFRGPRDAWAAGIVAIHQETAMFDELSVAENVFMGHAPRRGPWIDWRAARARAGELLATLDVDIDPAATVGRLGVAHKHMVGVARALSHDARVVIMDEPTAALSAREIEDLFRIVDRLKAEGRAILFVSHKFDEIFRLCGRWTCLRDGAVVGAGAIADATETSLVELMVGRPRDDVYPARVASPGRPVVEVEDLSNATEFDGLSFVAREGEVLGFYGLVGAGRSEAMQCLFGLTRPTRGSVKVDGKVLRPGSPARAQAAGLAYVPEDRGREGATLAFGVRANVTLASLSRHARAGLMSRAAELATTRDFGGRLRVKAAHWEQRVGELSGGNQQKVVLAKWLATRPRALVLDEPTKGVDVGAKAAVHRFVAELASSGLAVILVSSELPEVLGLSDRIVVMREGRIAATFSRAEATPAAVLRAASGLVAEAAA